MSLMLFDDRRKTKRFRRRICQRLGATRVMLSANWKADITNVGVLYRDGRLTATYITGVELRTNRSPKRRANVIIARVEMQRDRSST